MYHLWPQAIELTIFSQSTIHFERGKIRLFCRFFLKAKIRNVKVYLPEHRGFEPSFFVFESQCTQFTFCTSHVTTWEYEVDAQTMQVNQGKISLYYKSVDTNFTFSKFARILNFLKCAKRLVGNRRWPPSRACYAITSNAWDRKIQKYLCFKN